MACLSENLIQLKEQLDVKEENPSKKSTQRIEELKEKIALKEKEIETLSETLELDRSLFERKNETESMLAFLARLVEHVEEDLPQAKLTAQIEKFKEEKTSI